MSETGVAPTNFSDLGLPDALLAALAAVGYETPTPIQAETIPVLMQGRDLLGHAPTGTGKTAAFALPLLSRLNNQRPVQVMVLTPTRELAIQVAEAFQRYAAELTRFHVLPVYGGQEYSSQIRALRRGVQVVVGTPGRVMDHMRKGTLSLDRLQSLILDEADEMLRMGFLDDVEWILQHTPDERQIGLFSATMPKEIKQISKRYLRDPHEIKIETKTATAETIRQRYWLVNHREKLDALTRILEVEPFEAMLMFVRTKIGTTELAEKLVARGFAAAAINGDMPQRNREQTIGRLKTGALDILVATDVAARGLDVDRISHVVNYDIPHDTEAYIHRIGRTGRAGRLGDAILFVTPREQRMLQSIERATRQKIELMELPTREMVNDHRIAKFTQSITDTLAKGELEFTQNILEQYSRENDIPAIQIAAALAKLSFGSNSLRLEERPSNDQEQQRHRTDRARRQSSKKQRHVASTELPDGMERFRIEVGYDHDVKPANIVGAIANEAGLDAAHIGHIDISEKFSLVDLPDGMPRDIFRDLKKVWVCGRQLNISRLDQSSRPSEPSAIEPSKKKQKKKGEKPSKRQKRPKNVKARKQKKARGRPSSSEKRNEG
ncbi:MAG: DEAD/DEAH box helicase [Pseudomonadota bacterium]